MRRDMELVRWILRAAEDADGDLSGGAIVEHGCAPAKMVHHVELMRAHGLIDASVTRTTGPGRAAVVVRGLTWDGYDYLDAIRSDDVWARAKAAIADTVGDASLSVIRSVCESLAASMVRARLGI